jgi:hypothetical protein
MCILCVYISFSLIGWSAHGYPHPDSLVIIRFIGSHDLDPYRTRKEGGWVR